MVATDLLPQRPRSKRELAEPAGHILEPEWEGTRALVRIGRDGPRFVGYSGPIDGPRELYEAISAEARCASAVLDGVLVQDFSEDQELEMDSMGNAFVRRGPPRTIYAAFDLLEVDDQVLLDVPLLERKRHLEGVLVPSRNVRLTAYRSRDLRSWRETLQEQGFRRVVLKDWNSTYEPGRTADTWTVVEKIREIGRR